MYTPEVISSVANFITVYEDSQFNQDSHFYLKCVLCSQRQSFGLLFYLTTAGVTAVLRS